jgi:Sec1 family
MLRVCCHVGSSEHIAADDLWKRVRTRKCALPITSTRLHHTSICVSSRAAVQLKKYQEVMTSLAKRNLAPGTGESTEASEAEAVQEATKQLMTTVKSLPELRAQKRKLDSHMNLLYALLNAIKARTLDKYHDVGQSILSGASPHPSFDLL